MERDELRNISDENITELIKQLKKEQEKRAQRKLVQGRVKISEHISQIFELTTTLNDWGLRVEFEIEDDGNNRVFNLTDFVMNKDTHLKVALHPVSESES